MTMILFDGRNHPPAATLIADGIGGGLLYTGTPNSGKDFTAAQYADYKAHGLITIMGYENTTTDINGGYPLGTQHAADFLADCRAKRVSPNEPALAAVDEHVSAANISKAMAYQNAFRSTLKAGGWTGPIGIYGFSEVLIAAHAAGTADFYFGAGNRATLPAYTNIWQDNTGTITVAGSADDRDVVLIPLPTGDDMAADFDTVNDNPIPDSNAWRLLHLRQLGDSPTSGFVALGAKLDAQAKQIATLVATQATQAAAMATLTQAVAAEHNLTVADIQAVFDAELAKTVHVQVDVTAPTGD